MDKWRKAIKIGMTAQEQKAAALELREQEIRTGIGEQCCTKYFCWVFACSTNWLYYAPLGVGQRQDVSKVDLSILCWFDLQKDVVDKMPDTDDYQMVAPYKTDVYDWYKEDMKTYPGVFTKCSASYFNKVWRKYRPEMKLHRWLRFTKCPDCDRLRQIRWNRKSTQIAKDEARNELQEHYRFIKEERAYAEMHKVKGILNPRKYLSIAMDGTDQLPNGLPQFRYGILALV